MHLRPYVELMRLHKPVGIGLLVFPCWWAVLLYSPALSWHTLCDCILFLLGAFSMRSGGCVINDMADRHIDAQVERTKMRPLASGVLNMRQAWQLLIGLLCIALLVASALGEKIMMLGLCWLPLVAAYPFMKRITWWPQAFLGITFGAGSLFGMVATTETWHISGFILYAACICWVIGYDTIYACQDAKEDAIIGVKSTALLFGKQVKTAVALCYAAMICLLSASFYSEQITFYAWMGLAAATSVLIYQLWHFSPQQPSPCAKCFHMNLWVGMMITLGLLSSRL
jgi:4-hydroxybenzoate polyprenyltransferase